MGMLSKPNLIITLGIGTDPLRNYGYSILSTPAILKRD